MFEYSPSVGASGGLIVIWNSARLTSILVQENSYSITMKFTCCLSGKIFHLTNIYAPEGKADFINWLYNFDTDQIDNWVLAGDFNLIRPPDNINRLGANMQDIILSNDLILHLDMAEI